MEDGPGDGGGDAGGNAKADALEGTLAAPRPAQAALDRDAARIGAELARLHGGTDPFAAAVRATRMPMIVTDPRQPDNPVVFANDSFCRLTGYAREQILGRNCRFLQGVGTDPDTVARIRAAVQGATSIEVDIRNYRRDGEPFWNRLLMAPVRDAGGELAYFFASQVDVTLERERVAGLESRNAALMAEVQDRLRAQRETEARLRELNATLERRVAEALAERKLLADIVEGTDAFVQVLGRDWRFLAINRAAAHEFARVFGVPRPRVGDGVLELLAGKPKQQAAVRALWTRALAGEEYTEVAWFDDPRGGRRAYEMRFYALRDAEGRQVGAYQFVYDVTGRLRVEARLKEAEEALRQSQKMEAIGQLTGGIAHDFNNMLQGIAGGLEMMQARIRQGRPEEAARYVEFAERQVRRAAALTHRLLAFARRQALAPARVELDGLVGGMAELVRRTVGPGITVRLRLQDGCWPVRCDANQLENALLNLSINARDAMPRGGELGIETAHVTLGKQELAQWDDALPGDYVRLTVSDTGTGMTPDVLAHAFEPFFTTKPLGQGTGLGLSQIYGFVRQSGGIVRLESEEGQGTRVHLFLARSEEAANPAEEAGGDAAEAPREAVAATVLLVDDEEELRGLVRESLQDMGCRVLEAADGTSGLRMLREAVRGRAGRGSGTAGGAATGLDLLVTDVGLPGGLNGRQLADHARELIPGLPVLLITGYAGRAGGGPEQVAPGMEVLGKPFRLAALADRVQALLAAGAEGAR